MSNNEESQVIINHERFWQRLQTLHAHWQQQKHSAAWNESSSLLILCGKSAEIPYQRNNSIHLWLFGYELLSTIIVITVDTIHVCGGSKTYTTLLPLLNSQPQPQPQQKTNTNTNSNSNTAQLSINLIQKQKNANKNYETTFAQIIKYLTPKVGFIQDTAGLKGFADKFLKFVSLQQQFTLVSYSSGLSDVMMVKDKSEANTMSKVCNLSSLSLLYFQRKMMEKLIENNNKKQDTHKSLSHQLLRILDNPRIVSCQLKSDNLDVCYEPIIRSCSSAAAHNNFNFSIKTWPESDGQVIHYEYGTIVIQIGFRLRDYCSNIARTFLIDASDEQKEIYAILLEVYKQGLLMLRANTKLSAIYDKCLATLLKSTKGQMLQSHFVKSVGWGIGLEFREKNYVIRASNNERVCKSGMVFNFQVGFENIIDESKLKRGLKTASKYSLLIADTVRVTDTRCEFLTRAKRKFIDYSLHNDDDEHKSPGKGKGKAKAKVKKPKKMNDGHHETKTVEDETKTEFSSAGRVTRSSTRRNATKVKQDTEARAQRATTQNKLRVSNQLKLASMIEKNEDGNFFNLNNEQAEWKEPDFYKAKSQFCNQSKFNKLCVDDRESYECLICPIMDMCVAFHISTIKNFSLQLCGINETFLRINLITPVPVTSHNRNKKRQQPDVVAHHPFAMYIKELTYKSGKSDNLQLVYAKLKELQKTVRLRAKQQKEKPLVQQDRLQKASSSKLVLLKEVSCKPSLGGRKKGVGRLECHLNGLRFIDHKRNEVNIIFNNIKHAFFQPSKHTPSVLLHFHLKSPVILTGKAKKSTYDIQVYRDVIDRFEEISGRHYDYDGMRAEQEEKRRIIRANKQFLEFTQKVVARSKEVGYVLNFDRPSMSCVLHGVPNKQSTKMFPTNSALVAFEDSPPWILSCAEVELAHFERVSFSLKNFDVVFVFKDYKREPKRVTTIPREYLDTLQDFLNWKGILYSCGRMNLDWKSVMQRVRSNFPEFVRHGGWDFLREDDPFLQNHQSSSKNTKRKRNSNASNNSDDYVPSGSEYAPDSEEWDEENSDDYSQSEGSASYGDDEDDEDDYSDAASSEDAQGESWEALERKAQEADRKAKLKERNRKFTDDNFNNNNTQKRRRLR